MSALFPSSSGKLHETALSMGIGTKSTLNMHQVGELDSGIGTMLKQYRHQVGIKLGLSRDQVVVQSPTQLGKSAFYKQVTEQVTEQVRSLLRCLKTKPLGRRDAMVCIGLNSRPTFIYDYLKPAIRAGFVEMTLPNSPKSPTQKYRLTAKGKDFLARGGQEDME